MRLDEDKSNEAQIGYMSLGYMSLGPSDEWQIREATISLVATVNSCGTLCNP